MFQYIKSLLSTLLSPYSVPTFIKRKTILCFPSTQPHQILVIMHPECCYYCEQLIHGTYYVFKDNEDYVSCDACVPDKCDWRRVCSAGISCFHCHCSPTGGKHYVCKRNSSYILCEHCIDFYELCDYYFVSSGHTHWHYHHDHHHGTYHKCFYCNKKTLTGKHYVFKHNSKYAVCSDCIGYFDLCDFEVVNAGYWHNHHHHH